MFAATVIGVAFITMFIAILPIGWLEERNYDGLGKALLVVALFAGLYCFLAGIHLAGGWEDPFANADPETLGKASTRGRGRGGLIILAISYWPYVLMGIGGYVVYNTTIRLWNRRQP